MTVNKAQIELTAVDKTRVAIQSAQRGLDGLNKSADTISRSLAGLGGVISIGAFVSFARGAVSAAAALDDMAEATGATVEGLSKLTTIARIGGTDIGQVETALIRLNKALFAQDEESSDAARALQAIGLAAADLRSQSPDQALEQVARAFARFQDGASKTAAAVALFGRSGAQLLPLLKDIAEQGDVVASVTAQQAADAEKLEKSWRRLTVEASNFARSIALDLVPALQSLIDMTKAGGLTGALDAVVLGSIKGQTLDQQIADVRGQLDELARTGANVRQGVVDRILFGSRQDQQTALRAQLAALEALQANLRERGATSAGSPLFEFRGQGGGSQLPFTPKTSSGGRTKAEDSTKAIVLATEQILGLDKEWLAFQEEIAKAYEATEDAAKKALDEQTKAFVLQAEQVLGIDDASLRLQASIDAAYESAKKTNSIGEELGLTFTSAFEDAIVGGKNLSDVLRGLEQDILRIVTRKLVTEPLGEAISGAVKGSGIFDGLGSFFKGLLPSFDVGTPFVPQTMAAIVHRGEAIIPAARNQGGGNVILNITTSDAASFRASEGQITAQAARMLSRARRDL